MFAADIHIVGIVFAGIDETVGQKTKVSEIDASSSSAPPPPSLPYRIPADNRSTFIRRDNLIGNRYKVSLIWISFTDLNTVQIGVGLRDESNGVQDRLTLGLLHVRQRAIWILACQCTSPVVAIAFLTFDQTS